ncbi:MAG: DUF2096 domain-containing protein [Methanobacteriaceae archaeon]|jgi:hypothetical protein|nr:MAG: DUF2096 domain-containing protein [Methanobacterium sp. BRmetb2]MCC7558509.1 DUF2096 domain-containing protein [Methanobacteriaceae archaeon]
MNVLPLEQTWMVLVELLTDLKKRGIKIPKEVNENLRLARTDINFYKTDPTNPEMMKELKRINEFLNSVQDILINFAEEIDEDYGQKWIQKLQKASMGEEVCPVQNKKSKFIVGAPPGFSVVRVSLKEPLAEDRVQDVAEEYNLIIEFDEDEVISVFGDKENIKKGLKEISSFFRD